MKRSFKKIAFFSLACVLCGSLLMSCADSVETDTTPETSEDTNPSELSSYPSAELVDGAIYRISSVDQETFKKQSLTVQNFGTSDNEFVKLDMYGKNLSQMWRAHKNDDGTYSFENMANRFYLSIKNPSNYKKEKKLSVCKDGTNDEAKKWKIYSTDDSLENCVMENVHSSLCVTPVAARDTVYAEQKTYAGEDYQRWSFKKVSDGNGEYPYVLALTGDYEGSASCPEIFYYDGVYYNYNMTGPITLKTSTDLIHWTLHPDKYALKNGRPAWLEDITGDPSKPIWAPGVYQMGGRYYLYYCTSSSGTRNSAIAVAVSDDPSKNEWTDLGLVIRSYHSDTYVDGVLHSATNFNAIDPNVIIDDNGVPYLVYGSYWDGIFMRQLDPNTGKFDETNTNVYHLAKGQSDMEAPYVVKHGDYYYLFVARGGLKKGTYYWAVGRSENVTGPYVDKDGKSMLSGNGGTRLTEWKEGIEGVGHAQCFFGPDGQTYMVSESWSYRDDDKNSPVTLSISTIVWTEDGWPVTALDKNVLKALGE